jgi:hypothetical protein
MKAENRNIILDDGTPIEDILAHKRELVAEVAYLKNRLREIQYVCLKKGLTPSKRRDDILAIVNRI